MLGPDSAMGADNPKKKGCIACGRSDVPMTKEHFFPQWLIARAEAFHEGIEWLGREEISPYRATIPLCGECNADFGREIEGPMSRVFGDIEAGRGISDAEAELIVRWMWKFEGLAWMFHNPRHIYTTKYTLRERVLQPIDRVRGLLVLAVSLAQRRDPDFRDGTLGMDSANILNAIFVSAVFSRVALIVSLCDFADRIPREVSLYRLAPKRWFPGYQAKLFFRRLTLCKP